MLCGAKGRAVSESPGGTWSLEKITILCLYLKEIVKSHVPIMQTVEFNHIFLAGGAMQTC